MLNSDFLAPYVQEIEDKQKAFLFKRMKALGIPESVAYEIPHRIYKQGYIDREDYSEWYLDKDTPKEIFLFSEVLRIECKDKDDEKGPAGMYFVQNLSEEQILYVAPVFKK